MPPHSSHLLQPLDVGCYGPLKRAYGTEIATTGRKSAAHITKNDFLAAFQKAFSKTLTRDNVLGGFRGAGVVPLNPEAVISRLEVRLRAPTPPTIAGPAEFCTPHHPEQLELSSKLLKERIARHQGSSPSAVNELLDRVTKGAYEMAMIVLIRDGDTANSAVTAQPSRKRRFLQRDGALTIAEGAQLAVEAADGGERTGEGSTKRIRAEGAARQQRRCGRCSRAGHNSRTCQNDRLVSAIPEHQSRVE